MSHFEAFFLAFKRQAIGTEKQYYDELGPEAAASEEDISLVSSDSSSPAAAPAATQSAPSGTAVDRVFGPAPSPSASPEAFSPSSPSSRPRGGGSSASQPRTEEEKHAEMVRDVLTGGAAGEETPEAPDAAEPVAIDLSAVGSSDGIVSTLDDEPSEGVSYGVRPFAVCSFATRSW